jgi:hypothetical protein
MTGNPAAPLAGLRVCTALMPTPPTPSTARQNLRQDRSLTCD